MLNLRLTRAMDFRRMIKAISTITDDAYIEFSEHATLIHANHTKTNVLALLHLSPHFFHHYQISRPFIVRTKLPQIRAFLLYHAADDDGVYIYSKDDNPATYLDFHIHNSRTNKDKIMTLKVSEINAEPHTYEPVHEFKVAIDPYIFKEIATHSNFSNSNILISVSSTFVNFVSGFKTIIQQHKQIFTTKFERDNQIITSRCQQDNQGEFYESECDLDLQGEFYESECDLIHAPRAMLYELRLPCEFAKSFIPASSIADVVYIRDSYSRIEDPTMLEFSFGRFSRLLYFIRSPCVLQS